ncbi:thioredoxin-dependent thiol peroxidase [Georgenia sunbinii]|uniref:thioredoxin-dependent thiol peroxidase n=1 Tax=Georgenia sunbinii TaxID=3117728 RepID=UPI003D9C0E82
MARLAVGDTVPDFTLTASDGSEVSLAALRGSAEQGVVVYFYPAAATPGCTTQACDFRDNLNALAAKGYTVVGVSPDEPAKLASFAADEGLTFPLVSDPEHEVIEAWGAWGEKKNYGRTYEGLIRSTVVVDPAGTVTLAQYNVKATGHVARLRKELGVD